MRLVKKLSLLLAVTAPLALGCGGNPSSPQQAPTAPTVLQPGPQPLLPTVPTPTPPVSPTGAPVVAVIQDASGPTTGFTAIVLGTNLSEHPSVTFTSPSGVTFDAAFVARDQNNPAQLLVGFPNIQAQQNAQLGFYSMNLTNELGQTATGPNLQVRVYATSFSFGMSNLPNASTSNHLGSGTDADPIAIACADLNKDGTKDFVVALHDDASVSALLQGSSVNQNFSVLNLAAGHVDHPRALALVDLNHDGKLDIIVGGETTTGTKLISQPASGAWSSSQDIELSPVSNRNAFAVADFNMDGKPDVAVAPGKAGSQMTVLHGTGDLSGSVTAHDYNGFLSNSYAVATGQFDSDATRPDLALMSDTKLRILSNQSSPSAATATFVAGATLNLGGSSPTRNLAIGDANGDSQTDVFTTKDTYGNNEIEVVLSNASNGIWSVKDAIPGSANMDPPKAMTLGDFNGDGLMDIAVVTGYHPGQITIYPGKPSPWPNVPSSVGPNTNLEPLHNRNAEFNIDKAQTFNVCDQPADLVTSDTDGDGLDDIAIACKKDDMVQVLTNKSS